MFLPTIIIFCPILVIVMIIFLCTQRKLRLNYKLLSEEIDDTIPRRSTYASRHRTNVLGNLCLRSLSLMIDPSQSEDPTNTQRLKQALSDGDIGELVAIFESELNNQADSEQGRQLLEQLKKFT